jgi:hypothetical protein
LASAALTGTIVRRILGTESRAAFLFGAGACLLLAPVPLPFPGPHFTTWASGLASAITMYGMAAVTVLLALHVLVSWPGRCRAAASAIFGGTVIASLIPTHVLLAGVAFVGVTVVASAHIARSIVANGRLPYVADEWRTLGSAAVLTSAATIGWGVATGHGIGASGASETVPAFADAWRESIVRTVLGGGVLLLLPIAWLIVRRKTGPEAWVYAVSMVIVALGAVIWGTLMADYNTFHAYFGALLLFATPAAAAATSRVWTHARAGGHSPVAALIFLVCGVQLGLGAFNVVGRLVAFGPSPVYEPIPVTVLEAIELLPRDAKLAYSCRSLNEPAFWDPALVSIDAHTGRRVVPMCFQGQSFELFITGKDAPPGVPHPLFRLAPQQTLYPDAGAQPSAARVTTFLSEHGIDYIYADSFHGNELLPDGATIVSQDGVKVVRVP